ncbi:MAG: hypothetical protein N2V75_11425 [Methanophagales archaeon]|nr:hypothetical protein [Methanophagales archaeon]
MRQKQKLGVNTTQENNHNFTWLKAVYHFHVFHYRMPETAAIAAVTSFVPSPLTVKMAMVASLFQIGDTKGVDYISKHLDKVEVKITPSKAAVSFKAFMRYRSPPAVESEKGLDEAGSYYPNRPHIREYAIFQDYLTVYVKVPEGIKNYAEKALMNMRYLGSKDSLVTCVEIAEKLPEENKCISEMVSGLPGVVVLLADFKSDVSISDVEQLIPGNREENMYEKSKPYTLPGKIKTKGKSKIFVREI